MVDGSRAGPADDSLRLAIRLANPTDLPALQAIRAAAFAPVFRSFHELVGAEIADTAFRTIDEEQAELLAGLAERGPDKELHVALADGRSCGFVSVLFDRKSRLGEIGLNAVHPDWSGRGIGARLYEFALERMRQEGMAVATVGTGGDPSHAPARRAYQKAGFEKEIPSVWLCRKL